MKKAIVLILCFLSCFCFLQVTEAKELQFYEKEVQLKDEPFEMEWIIPDRLIRISGRKYSIGTPINAPHILNESGYGDAFFKSLSLLSQSYDIIEIVPINYCIALYQRATGGGSVTKELLVATKLLYLGKSMIFKKE